MMIKRLMLFCFVIIGFNVNAQKLHFTQFGMAPLTVNPALTGSFNGTARVTGIFRDQYFGNRQLDASGEAFINLGIGIEWNALRGLGEYDWISVGVNIGDHRESATSEIAAELQPAVNTRIKNQVYNMSLAYHIGMGKKGSSVLSIGAQYGQFGREIDQTLWTHRGQGTTASSVLASGNQSAGYGDLAAGLTYTTKGKNSLFRTGLSTTHIIGGNQSLLSGGSRDDKSLGIIGFVQVESAMNKKSTFKPALLYQSDGPFQKFEAQARFGYLFDAEKQITLNYGLGYRVGESAQLLLGVDYGQLQAGLAYDFVLGGVRDAARETIELGVAYIFNIEKKPEIVPSIFCPRL